jgi:hypothetical protein
MAETERRGVERFDLQIPAKVRVVAPDMSSDELELTTSNVCCGGAFFHTSSPLPEGTDVQIDLILNLDNLKAIKDDVNHVYIELKGTVVRSESEGMSICFDERYEFRPIKPEH